MKKPKAKPKPELKIKRAIVLPDLHCPEHDEQSLAAVNKFMRENSPWDYLIYLGDVLDLNCISSHNETNLRAVEGQRLLSDYRLADELILKPHEAIVRGSNRDARIIYIEGNHEDRVTR